MLPVDVYINRRQAYWVLIDNRYGLDKMLKINHIYLENHHISTTQVGNAELLDQFRRDVTRGLLSQPKRLDAKYFYDENGDALFQAIMKSPDYYLTDCELEIFKDRTAQLAQLLHIDQGPIELIELGAGDASKSIHLLRYLANKQIRFRYIPIDISAHILRVLSQELSQQIPGIQIQPETGEYFDSLHRVTAKSTCRKAVLFLGSNIGNMEKNQAAQFLRRLHQMLQPDDFALIGFDLKKNPQTILRAYQDRAGLTSAFNLNLLQRINRELDADFEVDKFQHFQNYDPLSGACRSFLISLDDQLVHLNGISIPFSANEPIDMEISQKFSHRDISDLAFRSGFRRVGALYDQKQWFVDEVWRAK